jgi:hypothetical protein
MSAGVTAIAENAGAFERRDAVEDLGDGPAEGGAGSLGGVAQLVFELGKELLCRSEVPQEHPRDPGGARGWPGAAPSSRDSSRSLSIAGSVPPAWMEMPRGRSVENGSFSTSARKHAPNEDACPVDRPVDQPWRLDAIVAQRGDEGAGLPVPEVCPRPRVRERPCVCRHPSNPFATSCAGKVPRNSCSQPAATPVRQPRHGSLATRHPPRSGAMLVLVPFSGLTPRHRRDSCCEPSMSSRTRRDGWLRR